MLHFVYQGGTNFCTPTNQWSVFGSLCSLLNGKIKFGIESIKQHILVKLSSLLVALEPWLRLILLSWYWTDGRSGEGGGGEGGRGGAFCDIVLLRFSGPVQLFKVHKVGPHLHTGRVFPDLVSVIDSRVHPRWSRALFLFFFSFRFPYLPISSLRGNFTHTPI